MRRPGTGFIPKRRSTATWEWPPPTSTRSFTTGELSCFIGAVRPSSNAVMGSIDPGNRGSQGAGAEAREHVVAVGAIVVAPGVADEPGPGGPAAAPQHPRGAEQGLGVVPVHVGL